MKIPADLLSNDLVSFIESKGGRRLKRLNTKKGEMLVFPRRELNLLNEVLKSPQKMFNMSETATVVVKAYTVLMRDYSKITSPADRAALVAAVMGIYNADPAIGSRLVYMLQ
jgi:hypothetical protein